MPNLPVANSVSAVPPVYARNVLLVTIFSSDLNPVVSGQLQSTIQGRCPLTQR
jgi:hypothetical protein